MAAKEGPKLDTPPPSAEAAKAAPSEGQTPAPVEPVKAPTAADQLKARQEAEKAKVEAKHEVGNAGVKAGTTEQTSGLLEDVVGTAVGAAAKAGESPVDAATKAKIETSLKKNTGEDGEIAEGFWADLAELGAGLAEIFKDLFDGIGKKKKDPKKEGEAVVEGQTPKELPSSWPEKLPVEELEYQDAPISTAKGFPLHLSSPFGDRFHPVAKEERFHEGLDLNYGSGQDDEHLPLYARVPLQVKSTGYSEGGGNSIHLFDPEHPETVYACLHLDERPPFEEGDLLEPGTCFAKIGDTGTLKTASHLHLEVEKNGEKVDPMTVVKESLRLA